MTPVTANPAPTKRKRHGWREPIDKSIYRSHAVHCKHSETRTPSKRRCCPWSISAPGKNPGTNATVTLPAEMTLRQVRNELKSRQAAGRPKETVEVEAPTMPLLWEHFHAAVGSKTHLTQITREHYVRAYKNHIHGRFGNVPVDKITRKDVSTWIAELSQRQLAPATVAGLLRVLRMALGVAVHWDLIPKNPATGIKLATPDPATSDAKKVLTPEQVETLLGHPSLTLRIETMLRAAVHAGLRRAELCGLRWTDIDFEKKRIHVRRGYNGGPTKGKRERAVPINDRFIERLHAWHEESTVTEGNAADGYVWPGRKGGEMAPHTPTQAHARAMYRAGLSVVPVPADGPPTNFHMRTTPRPLVTLHGLRHTFVSTLLANGGKLIDVSRVAGHASPAITAKVYAHLLDDDQTTYLADLFEKPAAKSG